MGRDVSGLLFFGFLFLEGFGHGFLENGLFFFVKGDIGLVFAEGFHFSGDGFVGGAEVVTMGLVGGGVCGGDAHGSCGGDGILVRSQEEKFPMIGIGLVTDALVDVVKSEAA